MAGLFWFQTGACGGDSMAILSADNPDFASLFTDHGIELLWHPSLSHAGTQGQAIDALLARDDGPTYLCVEGSVVTGPRGSGLFDTHRGVPKMDIVRRLAERATYVVAMGTCAAFGGVHAAPPNPTDATGLQFHKEEPGGLLPAGWRSKGGLPVINCAGCPCHPDAMVQTLLMLHIGLPPPLDHLNRPKPFFSTMAHQGCTRNEYYEHHIEEADLGGKGCLYFNLGCQGPMTHAVCNSSLWQGRSSKTRAGVPCFGCTSPSFPQDGDLFRTEKLGDVPVHLPLGVDRPHYMAYKRLARTAAPMRLVDREMEP